MMKPQLSTAIKLGVAVLIALTTACAELPGGAGKSNKTVKQKVGRPYQIGGIWYYPKTEREYDQVGIASWYGERFHGAPTANGEIFDMNEISAAHTTLPLPSWVEVTNLENNKRMVVRINDRGPFVDGRLIDLSKATARELGFLKTGVARVRVRLVDPPEGVKIAKTRPQPEPETVEIASLAPVAIPQTPSASNPVDVTAQPPDRRNSITIPARKPASKSSQETTRKKATSPGEVQQPYSKPVRPAAAAKNPAPRASNEGDDGYLVQVATFSSEENAKRLISRFDETYSAFLSAYSLEDGRVLNRVRLGPFQTRSKAEDALKAAADIGLNDARIFLQKG